MNFVGFVWVHGNHMVHHGIIVIVLMKMMLKKARDEQDRSRAALQRYLHYYKRYHNHHESLRLENKLLDQVQKRMELMQQQMSWIEVQFLQIACDVLRQCRQTLMYTYPFAFYLKRNNHS